MGMSKICIVREFETLSHPDRPTQPKRPSDAQTALSLDASESGKSNVGRQWLPLASVLPSMFHSQVCHCVFCCVSDVTHMTLSAVSCVLFKCYWHIWHIQHIRQRCLQGWCIINAVLCVLNPKLTSYSLLTRAGLRRLFSECKSSRCHFCANR